MRTRLVADGTTKTWVLVFDSGEDVLPSLEKQLASMRVKSARFAGIGGFQRATIAFFEMAEKRYRPMELDEQLEVMALNGNVSLLDSGELKVHPHVIVGKADGSAHGGHLLQATVRPTLELFLDVFPEPVHRAVDEATGLPLMKP